MTSDTPFIIADNQDITRAGLHAYITSLFGESRIVDVNDTHHSYDPEGGRIIQPILGW